LVKTTPLEAAREIPRQHLARPPGIPLRDDGVEPEELLLFFAERGGGLVDAVGEARRERRPEAADGVEDVAGEAAVAGAELDDRERIGLGDVAARDEVAPEPNASAAIHWP
jgi:hypothetical protein